MISSKRRSDKRKNSMWRNTDVRLGAITTPTKCDKLDSRLRRIQDDLLRLLRRQGRGLEYCSRCTVSMVSTNKR